MASNSAMNARPKPATCASYQARASRISARACGRNDMRGTLAARCGLAGLFVRVLISEKLGADSLPVDCGAGIGTMLRAAGLEEFVLGPSQCELARLTTQGIPNLLDEAEPLTDGKSCDIYGRILHGQSNLCAPAWENNCFFSTYDYGCFST